MLFIVNRSHHKIMKDSSNKFINNLKKKQGFEAQLESLERTIEKLEGYSTIHIS